MRDLRLDKYLCEAGFGTRSQVKRLIRAGAVQVDGICAERPEQRITGESRVYVQGERIRLFAYDYWMLNKPAGVVSATEDSRFSTVVDFLPEEARRDVFPVGRLDRDTEGLLLLTNDGKLAHFLLSPKRHVDKVYFARLDRPVDRRAAEAFAQGLDIGDAKLTLPARLEFMDGTDAGTSVFVTLREGRFHQVKRMFAAVGAEVLYLKRLSMGPLKLDEALKAGECRRLTQEELDLLKEEIGCWST